MAKPIKMLELYYQMIQFLIISNSNWKNEKITKENKKESIKAGLLTYDCILQSFSFERFYCYYQTLSLTPARS